MSIKLNHGKRSAQGHCTRLDWSLSQHVSLTPQTLPVLESRTDTAVRLAGRGRMRGTRLGSAWGAAEDDAVHEADRYVVHDRDRIRARGSNVCVWRKGIGDVGLGICGVSQLS